MRNQRGSALLGVLIIAAVIAAVTGGVALWKSYYSEDTHTNCKVLSKDRTKNSDGNSDARVYTENCGTFQVKDTLVKGNFRSGDLYGSIQPDHVYDFTSIGWRNGFFSMFPNIIKVTAK